MSDIQLNKKEIRKLKGHFPECINIFKKPKKSKDKKNKNYLKIIFKNLSKKYNSTPHSKNIMIINDLIEPKVTHYVALFKDYLIIDCSMEFMSRFYFKKESKERIPNFYHYYKNYFMFFLKPTFSDFDINSIIQEYSEKLAEIYYNEKTNEAKNKKIIDDKEIEMSNKNNNESQIKNKILTDSIKNVIDQITNDQSKDKKVDINNNSISSIIFKENPYFNFDKSGMESTLFSMVNMMENHSKVNKIDNIKMTSSKNKNLCDKVVKSEIHLSENNETPKNKTIIKLNNNNKIFKNSYKLSMPKLNLKSIGNNDQIINNNFSNRLNINSTNRNNNINKIMDKVNKLVKSNKIFKSKNIVNIFTEREKQLKQENKNDNFTVHHKKLMIINDKDLFTFSEPKDKFKLKISEKNINERRKELNEINNDIFRRVRSNIRTLTEPKPKNTKYIINTINIINNYNIRMNTNSNEKYLSLNKNNKSRNNNMNDLYTYNTNTNTNTNLNKIKAINLKVINSNNLIPLNSLSKNNNTNNIQIFKTFKKEISLNNYIYDSPKPKENSDIKKTFNPSKILLKIKNNNFHQKFDENYNIETTPRVVCSVNNKKNKCFICFKK